MEADLQPRLWQVHYSYFVPAATFQVPSMRWSRYTIRTNGAVSGEFGMTCPGNTSCVTGSTKKLESRN